MFSQILLNTILIPLIFGAALFIMAQYIPKFHLWGALLVGAAMFGIFVLLEGWPMLPPISSKPKVAVLIAIFTAMTVVTTFWRINRVVLFVVLLGAGLLWIGWNRVDDFKMFPRFVALSAPILIGGWAFQKYDTIDGANLAWPITLIIFGIASAVISLLGAYIGFAQMIGAMTAFIGGFTALAYAWILLRPQNTPPLPQNVLQAIFLSMMAVLIAIGLFAPEINTIAVATLSLGLLFPRFASRFDRFPPALKPIIYGITAAVPACIAIAIAAF